jgi:DNA-binding GntR family transcriptional regulator
VIVDNRQCVQNAAATPVLIERSSTARKVAAYLRERIRDGKLEPGDRLNELALAAELRVSRSPIREALAQLAGEGLVRVVPYKGTFVTALSRARLQDLLDFRIALEQFAVRRLIERATPGELDRLDTLVTQIHERAKAGDFSGAVNADLHVHEYLIELAGSKLLSQTYKALLGEFRLYISQTVRHYQGIDELSTEHAALLAALRAKRTSEAVSLIAAHIAHGFNLALKEIT